jgi:hypothetical protein
MLLVDQSGRMFFRVVYQSVSIMCDGRRQREEEEEAKFCFGRLKSLCQAIE